MQLLRKLIFVFILVASCAAQPFTINDPAFVQRAPAVSGTPPPTPDLLWLKLNNNTTDSSAAGNNGTAIASPTFTTGQDGVANHAISLNGTSQLVTCGAFAVPTTAVTFCAWIKPSSTPSSADVVSKGYDTVNTQYELNMLSGFISFNTFSSSAGPSGATGSTSISTSVWTFVCGTWDGTTWKVYVNGLIDGSSTGMAPIATAKLVEVGAVDDAGVSNDGKFPGLIDDARIYSSALTAPQITAIYTAGAQ